MSLTNVKDLDYLICLYLENEKDLLSFCSSNKYYYSLFNNDFIWRKKIDKYDIPNHLIEKNKNKNYFIELYIALKDPDFVKTIFLAICEERADILFLLFRDKNIDVNYMFTFNKKYAYYFKTYSSNTLNPNYPAFYSPISLIIKSGSQKMWDVIKTYVSHFNESHYILAITSKNINILKDLLEYNSNNVDNVNVNNANESVLLFSLQSHNVESTELLLDYVNEDCINKFFNNLIYKDVDWGEPENRNLAFEEFLHHPKVFSHVRFYKHLGNNNFQFIRLLQNYNF